MAAAERGMGNTMVGRAKREREDDMIARIVAELSY
jgi:hypothetical protein